MMILIIFSYIRKRSYDYVLLDVMGIQKRHKYIFIGCEYLGIVVISILGGILFGAILSEIIKIELEKNLCKYNFYRDKLWDFRLSG